ncbi:glycoside hydrolase family 3 N-terminal domain-containing protein [Flavimarina sp. Hel_I_48]|uniref:glycoside hydrolase family 3 N-terminal domain-containing protein n=1 Tax=Flavimarina sp. Hel_I_48 TaxID=1392488 RepID=UPI001F137F6A|nr:glycoside hydrolase family 3 N-terminal domain-containing protein [Flavimarina sp. Hel_I_48]
MNKLTRFAGFWGILVLFLPVFSVFAQEKSSTPPVFLEYTHSAWVDSIVKTLTPQERIAQLFMLPAYSTPENTNDKPVLDLIKNHKIGGIIFMQGGPVNQVKLMNRFQAASQVPLLGATDAEWGLGMRLDSTMSFPYQMALGAIQGEELIQDMGVEIARQLKNVGLQLNFAPVVDVNNNPDNPVINYRSFGENKENVAKKGIAYMKGMQQEQVLTTAKHFPGHGDTATDSHYGLPQINHTTQRLDSLELYPFKALIKAGVGGVMVAHLNIPAMDSTGVASTLSKPIISGILQDKLGFQGLIVTDAMNMKGVTVGNEIGVVDKRALVAGNDLIEFTENVAKAIKEIEKAVKNGEISQAEIDERCRKILAVKQWVGLNNYKPLPTENLVEKLYTPEAQLLNRNLVEASLTVLKNDKNLIPLRKLDTLKIASLSIGRDQKTTFQQSLDLYAKVRHFNLPEQAGSLETKMLMKQLKEYNVVLIGLHDHSLRPQNSLRISTEVQQFIEAISQKKNTLFSIFKNPYVLNKLEGIENSAVLIVAYQDSETTEELAAQLIFGGIDASGKLPVSVGEKFKSGDGMDVKGGLRFKYTLPEDAGMHSKVLHKRIDSLMKQAMDAKAIPGGQIFVAKDQKVVFHKAYGLHQYSDTVKVKKTDLYDLASVTKISSALPALMELSDEGKFDLDNGIDAYLPSFKHSNKAGITFRQILTHQARLQPWIPYWKNTLRENGSYKWYTFKKDSSRRFPTKVNDQMWLHRNYKEKIFKAIKKSPLLPEAKYKYSGLAFYLLPTIVENITGEDFQDYIHAHFYDKLGAVTLGYNPSEKFKLNRIVPTEHDYQFRHEPIHGSVHDEGAIMMGGVSANAGLFANANDLAKLMQMYLNMGAYGGERYIDPETLKEWSTVQFPENDNYRGIGFDKPYLEYKEVDSNTAEDASKASFGHTGFTGIMVWMDPEKDLLYLFLSNRVLPTRENTRLYFLNTRTQIQQVLYDAME